MRIIIYALLLNIVATYSYAQVAKGQWMVGGSAYINPERFIDVSVRPTAAYMISNKFAVGALLELTYSNGRNFHYFSGYLIPTVRYYFGNSRTQPFLMAGYGVANGTFIIKDIQGDNEWEFSFYGGGALGLSHQLNRNIAIELMVGRSNSAITVYSGTFVHFGFQIFLNKKNHEEE